MKNTGDKEEKKDVKNIPQTPVQAIQQAQKGAEPDPKPVDDKEKLKQQITEAKAQLSNLGNLVANCNRIKTEKRVVIAEDPTGKDPENLFKFALTGDIVDKLMSVVDGFIEAMKTRSLAQQDQLLDEMNKYL